MNTTYSDPFAALQDAGAVPPVTDEALQRARIAVRRSAAEEQIELADSARRQSRMRFGMAAVGLVAASLVAGIVLLDSDGTVGTPAGASEVLERAAVAALGEQDLEPGPGQFLQITLTEQSWTAGEAFVSEERRTRTIWVPHDVDADWTVRENTEVLSNNSADPELKTWTQPSWAADDSEVHLRTYDPDWYATLSRDPEELMAQILEGDNSDGSGAAYEFQEIYSEVLRSGIAPPDVRAALFRGLADTPGMVVESDVATLDGRSGTALGHEDSTWRMVFDAETGAYIGERATDPDFPKVKGVEDGVTWLTSVSTKVVDSAPRG